MLYPRAAMPLRPRRAEAALAAPFIGVFAVLSCGGGCKTTSSPAADEEVTQVRHVDKLAGPSTTAQLAGARCAGRGGSCTCRTRTQEPETEPPAEGKKRFEIRVAADGGSAIFESSTLGKFLNAGPREACFYVDVPAGTKARFQFSGRADSVDAGFAPALRVAEYGAEGGYWYDILAVSCTGQYGKCDRVGADAWKDSLRTRKRGRLEPCGSAVVTGLEWQTSGGLAERDGGFFRDFSARFDMEVKPFATKFPPGSTECVPK